MVSPTPSCVNVLLLAVLTARVHCCNKKHICMFRTPTVSFNSCDLRLTKPTDIKVGIFKATVLSVQRHWAAHTLSLVRQQCPAHTLSRRSDTARLTLYPKIQVKEHFLNNSFVTTTLHALVGFILLPKVVVSLLFICCLCGKLPSPPPCLPQSSLLPLLYSLDLESSWLCSLLLGL